LGANPLQGRFEGVGSENGYFFGPCLYVYKSLYYTCRCAALRLVYLQNFCAPFPRLQELYAAPGGAWSIIKDSFGLFWLVSKVMFVYVVSLKIRDIETNGYFFLETNRKQPKQIEFRFFSVQTKNYFFFQFEVGLSFSEKEIVLRNP
jgi:hypothetical protein